MIIIKKLEIFNTRLKKNVSEKKFLHIILTDKKITDVKVIIADKTVANMFTNKVPQIFF